MKYILITPVFNEAENIQDLIDSIVNQTKQPERWIIVDDGCTDETIDIVNRNSKKNQFIEVATHKVHSYHSSGPKISEAFLFGFKSISIKDYDLIGKIDADLVFPIDYFSIICSKFESHSKIGLYGGVCVLNQKEEIVSNDDHVRGALKLYRKSAYDQIGGIRAVEGWDSLDEYLLRYFEWEVICDSNLKVIHKRETDKKTSTLKKFIKSGKSFHELGYSLFISFLAALKLGLKPPYLLGGITAYIAYLIKKMNSSKISITKDQIRFINQYRWKKLKIKRNG